jgi:hypothetical protein
VHILFTSWTPRCVPILPGSLDTGVDYTHVALGGPGTIRAYDAAFGSDIFSEENTRRDGLFPTERVVDGFDFLGDSFLDSRVRKLDRMTTPLTSEAMERRWPPSFSE